MRPRGKPDELDLNAPPAGTSIAELAAQVRALLAPWFKEKRFPRFMVANPIRNDDGVRRFLALGLPTPYRAVAA